VPLLYEVISRQPTQRLVELTNADNGGGLKGTAIGGTVTVTAGSTAVAGAGTTFTSLPVGVAVQFSSQPGVSYVVASIQSDTALTLYLPYAWITTVGAAVFVPGINYPVLQQAVWDAMQTFQERTNFPYDDTTLNQNAFNAATGITLPQFLNKCLWAACDLVIAWLYNYRALPMPGSEGEAAWRSADARLKVVLNLLGDGAYAPLTTDSNFRPSNQPPGSLPNFDNERLGTVVPQAPGPFVGGGFSTLNGDGGGPGEYS
jgi:hypothetical protein